MSYGIRELAWRQRHHDPPSESETSAVLHSVARHEKGLLKEHKIAAEKIGMIKVRDLRGALATDMEMRNLLETNIQENEIVLTDLESRQVTGQLSQGDV